MSQEDKFVDSSSFAPLGIIALESSRKIGEKVDDYIASWRNAREHKFLDEPGYDTYRRDTYLIDSKCPRFGTGEAKGIIGETIRGMDVYILVDVCNYSITYTVCGHKNHMSPDDHFADVKRVIAAPGQWVRIDDDGTVYVDDEKLDEPYVDELALGNCNIAFPYQVPENQWFVMGDHRKTSSDSRNTAVGCVSLDRVVGVVLFRVWPFGEIGVLK